MIAMKTWTPLVLSCIAVALGCGTDPGSTDSGTENGEITGAESTGQTSQTTTDTADTSDTTGEPGDCDPSDAEIGPQVEVTIANQSDAALYLTESSACTYGSPFGITRGGEALSWLFGICESCGDALQGNCMCPGSCFEDTVIRIDPGGQYVGAWNGGSIYLATLAPECADEFCGDQCKAIVQAEAGDYVATAVASPMVTCEIEPCECMDVPDPDGWCRIGGARAGTDVTAETPFVYPDATAVEISFQ